MAVMAVRRRLAAPSRRITAYLRLLGRRRHRRSNGLATLRDEIESPLRRVVADVLGVEPDQLAGEVALQDDLAVDSLDLLEVLARVEGAFHVVVPDREAAAIRTIDDLIAVVTALVACRMRVRHETPAAAARVALRIGDGAVPRFLRTLGTGAYERELLRDELRRVQPDEPAVLSGTGAWPTSEVERMMLRASLAGADVRTEPGEIRTASAAPSDDGARTWPMDRLAGVWMALIGRLGAERGAAIAAREMRTRDTSRTFAEARDATNGEVARFRAVVETYLEALGDARPAVHAAARELGRLDLVRRAVDERLASRGEICEAYAGIVEVLAEAVDALQARDGRTPRRRPPRGITPRRDDQQELRA